MESGEGEQRRRRTSSRTNALQNILSALMGRELGRQPTVATAPDDEDTSSSDDEIATWPPLSRSIRPNKRVKPDPAKLEALSQTDFAQDTLLTSGDHPVTGAAGGGGKPRCSLLSFMSSVQQGGRRRRHSMLNKGERCKILSQYLPSKKKQLARFTQKIFCGTYSKCGNLFMSACQDQVIRIHDSSCDKFKLTRKIRARDVGWSVLDTALSPDSMHLIYSSWCDSIHQVSLFGNGRHVALPLEVDNRRFCLFSLRFSSDGVEIIGGANDGFIYLFDRERQSQSLRINAHDDDVNAVCFADTNTHILASGGDDGVCKIWDRRALRENDPRPVGIFAGHIDGITYADPKLDGRHIITNSKDQCIKLWDLRRFSSEDAIYATRRAVGSQNWDYRWQSVPRHLAKSNDRRITEDTCIMTYRGHTVLQTLIRCHFSPMESTGQRYIYTGCATGAIVIYDSLTGEVVKELKGHKGCVRDVSWHPYKPEIISSSWDYTLARWTYCPDDVAAELEDESGEHQRSKFRRDNRGCKIRHGVPIGVLELDDDESSN